MNFEARVYRYDVVYHAGGRRVGIRAAIQLYGQGDLAVGTAHFHRDLDDLPPLDQVAAHERDNPHVSLHFAREDFAAVLDLLRNEEPVYLVFAGNEAGEGVASLSTAPEAVGEGER